MGSMPLQIWPIIKNLLAQAAGILKQYQRFIRIGFGICALTFLALMVLSLVVEHRAARSAPSAQQPSEEIFNPVSLPQEGFFLPDEPDFLPKVILEREPRSRWTPEDARPFWKDPLQEGDAEKWRERIEQVVDELLEGVP